MSLKIFNNARLYAALFLTLLLIAQILVVLELRNLRSEISSIKEELKETSSQLESLEDRVLSLYERVEKAATVNDLLSLYTELSDLKARLYVMEEREARLENLIATIESEFQELSEKIGYPLIVRDYSGKEVVVAKKPARVVSLAPSVTETIYYLGALDLLVGVDDFSNFPPIIVNLKKNGLLKSIGGYWNPSIEAILALRPDLVVGVNSVPSHRVIKDVLSSYGVTVILLGDSSIDEVVDSLLILGVVLGKSEKAYELSWRIKYAILELQRLLEQARGLEPNVALIVWIDPLWIAGRGTWQHDIITLAGLRNAYSEFGGWQAVSPETLLRLDPSIIILTTHYGFVSRERFLEYLSSVLGDAVYEIDAIANGAIYEFTGFYEDSLNRPSPRFLVALYALAIIAHPDVFNVGEPPLRWDDSTNLLELIRFKVTDTTMSVVKYLVYTHDGLLAMTATTMDR